MTFSRKPNYLWPFPVNLTFLSDKFLSLNGFETLLKAAMILHGAKWSIFIPLRLRLFSQRPNDRYVKIVNKKSEYAQVHLNAVNLPKRLLLRHSDETQMELDLNVRNQNWKFVSSGIAIRKKCLVPEKNCFAKNKHSDGNDKNHLISQTF